ncbi:MAG: type II/IV secretion system ATPase subunit [Euryarchaeota archaeon]|nr:type II/IV secretion system ATPase subunit [Euryarchaeota archaeon]
MKDEPEIIKILRKEEILGKIEEKPQELELVTCSKDIFNKKTVGSGSVISDIPVTDNPDFKFMVAVERQLENILGIKAIDADMNQTDDQEFHTRLIGENDEVVVQRESMAPQKIQQVMEPPEKTKELPMLRRGKTIDASEDFLSNDQQESQKKNSKKADDERVGFGWKGLGSRKIKFDKNSKTYVYEVHEPKLEKEEQEIKNKLLELFELRSTIDVFEINTAEKSIKLNESLQKIIVDGHIKLNETSKDKIFYYIFQEFTGYGKIDILMHDEGIEDISCDGPNIPIFIYHKTYESIKSNIVFENPDELDSFAVKLAQICGKQISIYEPIIDGKLADGSRLSVMLAKTVTPFSTFTIRRFREDPFTPIDLINTGTMSLEMAAYFWLAIENGASILFCGGTASGKTSTLNAFALFLPAAYKIFSIEDTREVMLPHENWVASTTRTGFSQSAEHKTSKDIDMFDLTRAALRQRPQVVIVGEIRGQEAYALFQAMATGHISYSTIHASDIHTLVQRLENPPISLPKALLISLNLVVFLKSTVINGKPARRITNVIEIIKMEPSTNKLIFSIPFSWVSESEDHFKKEAKSILLDRTQSKKGWSDAQLIQEVKNRIIVLEWMRKNNLRSYKEVGKVVADYSQEPDVVLEKAKGGSE